MSRRTLVLRKLSKSDLDFGETQQVPDEEPTMLNQWLDSLEDRSSLLWVQFSEDDFKRIESEKRANSLESNEETSSSETDGRSSLVWVQYSKEDFTLDRAHCHKRANSLESSDETLSTDTDPKSSVLFVPCSEEELTHMHFRGSSLDSTSSTEYQRKSLDDTGASVVLLHCPEEEIRHVRKSETGQDSAESSNSAKDCSRSSVLYWPYGKDSLCRVRRRINSSDSDSKSSILFLPFKEKDFCHTHQRTSSLDSTESECSTKTKSVCNTDSKYLVSLLPTYEENYFCKSHGDQHCIKAKNKEKEDANMANDDEKEKCEDKKATEVNKEKLGLSCILIPDPKETSNNGEVTEFFCSHCKHRSISSIESSEGSLGADLGWVSYENLSLPKDEHGKILTNAVDELDRASSCNLSYRHVFLTDIDDDNSSLGSSLSLDDQDDVFTWPACKSIAHRESDLLVALSENCTLGPVCYFCSKKNSIVLRTQLSVRVHTIIEKLLTSEGRELRRALFSLKQIFQEDKDLVHEFVQNDGLSCLIKVGSEADQNYQNYILRALGQVMLYVDGMNGVMEHNQTIQWLYSLISSKFRLVVKTALKLLLVFVEYIDSNCMLLVKAVNTVDYSQGLLPYHNIMRLLKDFDSADTELLIYATTLINKVLNGVPDQDTYYDQVDSLEEQGMEAVIQRYMSKPGTDLDLLQQFQIYEAVLQYEDGEERGGCTPIRHLDENLRKTLRSRKSMTETNTRRKSRRHSTGNTPTYGGFTQKTLNNINNNNSLLYCNQEEFDESSSSQSSGVNNSNLNGSYKESNKANDAGVTPALKRRRERAERQRSFMREQAESAALLKGYQNNNNKQQSVNNNIEDNDNNINGSYTNALQQRLANGNILNRNSSRKDLTPYFNAVNKQLDSEDVHKQPWIMSCLQNQEKMAESDVTNENERNLVMQLKKENTVKDLTQKLANQSIIQSPSDENKISRFGDMSGLISKAKEGLAKSKSKADVVKSPTSENLPKIEVKKSENELRWEELVASLNRPLNLCDMDFTDLGTDDEVDILAPVAIANGIPPPPPPLQNLGPAPPPPPLVNSRLIAPPPVPNMPLFGVSLQSRSSVKTLETKIPVKKNKKTVKLFWKEVRDDPVATVKLKTGFIWDELNPVSIDTQKLEHLFESRAKDLINKKQQELNKNKEIIVLDHKRSNAINIGMTKLPPPRSIKTAILKMDSTIMNREGIEKLLTMLPTEEERTKIQEAQAANPDLPLGSAEQFLLTLASISELPARLKLWAFKLDFENSEREIAEPLMDLKQGFTVLRSNKTFRAILSTLLSVGNFLNGNEVKGFQIEYLTKVPEVKDTVHKHSLLHHLCHIVMEKFPEATDLYSEIGAITRASKVDFDELALNIQRLQDDCKASWDHLKLIAKHDGSTMMKVKMSDFLADCAERIILLGIVHRRIMNRFHKFLLWLGIPFHQVGDTKPNEFCRIVSEFALEYRTTRERVLQQLEKKANHRERNKTRGKMITDVGKFRSKEDSRDAELRQVLGGDISDAESLQGTLPWRHRRKDGTLSGRSLGANSPCINGNLTDGDDEILESLVKTATKGPNVRTAPRERKRTRHADRKSLRRTLKNGLSEEEKKILSGYIKAY